MLINLNKELLLNLPRYIKQGIVISCDLLICLFSVWLAFGLLLNQWEQFQGKQWFFLVTAILFFLPLFISFGLYRAIFRYVGSNAFLSIIRALIIYSAIVFFIFTIIGVKDIPRSIGVIQPILFFIGIGISRYFIRYWLGDVNNVKKFPQKSKSALIYGAGSAGRKLAISLANNNEISIKAFIDDNPRLSGNTINNIPVYSSYNLESFIQRNKITDVLLAIPSASTARRREIISSLNKCRVRVRTLPGLFDVAFGKVSAVSLYDLDMNDLLGRAEVPPQLELLDRNIRNQVILISGAGGSIGSELCRQIIKFSPKCLVLIDCSEHSLYLIYEELKNTLISQGIKILGVSNDESASVDLAPTVKLVPCLTSVRDSQELIKIFKTHKPDTVFHAAAYKHVPLVEQNPVEGIRNNVFGTLACAQASLDHNVRNFILVSTDKAVRPTSIMGASKRIAELILQAMANVCQRGNHETIFSIVRFGNVLGSSGSVVPLFRSQISIGGPISLTHPEVTRYFMTIPEASQLVIQAGSMATGGDIFILDMGEPVRIYDLAVKMIYLSGNLVKDKSHPHGNIEIEITGLRPGEKLYEELLIGENPQPTTHPKIMKANEDFLPWSELELELSKLNLALETSDLRLIKKVLQKLVPGFQPDSYQIDLNLKE